ncbi:hypothetical protein BOX15_Mlig029152g2, partial [Macrostomum lignano]
NAVQMTVRLEEAELVLPYELERPDKRRSIRLTRLDQAEGVLEFDLVHAETALANAIRRILLAEVPTVAVEKVLLYQNTSVIPDEVLCQRLGLVPLRVDPRLFRDCPDLRPTEDVESLDPRCVLVFDLDVECRKRDDGSLEHDRVYSSDFRWVPIGDQKSLLAGGRSRGGPAPVLPNILLARLGPGARIHARMLCVRGIGQDHAKFMPVATAFYRLLSDIRLVREVGGELAERLRACFQPGVISLTEAGLATVADPRRDVTCSREALRDPELRECVELGLVRDHFLFTVESTGCLPSEELVRESIKVLMLKCRKFLRLLGQE